MNLSALADDGSISDRIVEFELSESRKTLNIYECCDVYFEAQLTKAQARKLVSKLDELIAQMTDD